MFKVSDNLQSFVIRKLIKKNMIYLERKYQTYIPQVKM